jgi:cell division protein FtsA
LGGNYIINDIAIGLRLPPEAAERVLLRHGHALAAQVAADDQFTISPHGENAPVVVPRWKLAEIIQPRIEEILENVQQEIKRSSYDGLLPAGVMLCGGVAQVPGMQQLAQDVFGLSVQVGQPHDLLGLTDRVDNPASVVGVGLVQWEPLWVDRSGWRRPRNAWWRQFVSWLRTLLPG